MIRGFSRSLLCLTLAAQYQNSVARKKDSRDIRRRNQRQLFLVGFNDVGMIVQPEFTSDFECKSQVSRQNIFAIFSK
jgi:hypothetical protein